MHDAQLRHLQRALASAAGCPVSMLGLPSPRYCHAAVPDRFTTPSCMTAYRPSAHRRITVRLVISGSAISLMRSVERPRVTSDSGAPRLTTISRFGATVGSRTTTTVAPSGTGHRPARTMASRVVRSGGSSPSVAERPGRAWCQRPSLRCPLPALAVVCRHQSPRQGSLCCF